MTYVAEKITLSTHDKITILCKISEDNAGEVFTARDFYLQILLKHPYYRSQFSIISIGKLLEQTNIEYHRASRTMPKFYLCSSNIR